MRHRSSDQVTAAFQNTKPPALRIHPRSGTLTFSEEVDATTDALGKHSPPPQAAA